VRAVVRMSDTSHAEIKFESDISGPCVLYADIEEGNLQVRIVARDVTAVDLVENMISTVQVLKDQIYLLLATAYGDRVWATRSSPEAVPMFVVFPQD
jgi:hypothetical protein